MRRALVPLLVAALATPAWAAKKPAPPPPPAEPAAKPMPTLEERKAVFGAVDEAIQAGRKAQAADLFVEIVQDPAKAVFHAEAYARLGGVLEGLDLPYSALIAHERALATDPVIAASSAKAAIALADKVGDTALLEGVFAANVGLDVDATTRSRMAYLAAREAHHQGKVGTALAILKMVDKADPYFPEAKQLEGVLLAMQDKHEGALAPLQVAQATGKAAGRDNRFETVLTLNIARAYYGAGNFPRAIEYYAQVPRGSRSWADAQLERAWSHFRLDDMNGALGMLHSLQTPFLSGYFFPEAELLRIHSLFLMCKFPEATRQIDAFRADYAKVLAELEEATRLSPEAAFEAMAAHVDGKGGGKLPAGVSFRFEAEERFLDSLAAVRRADDELSRMKAVEANPFSAWAADAVRARKAAIIAGEGKRIRGRATAFAEQLQQMLADAEIAKLDMLQAESTLYSRAAATGKEVKARALVERGLKVKPGQRYWPYEGELWADEVGYFRFVAKADCPAELSGVTQ